VRVVGVLCPAELRGSPDRPNIPSPTSRAHAQLEAAGDAVGSPTGPPSVTQPRSRTTVMSPKTRTSVATIKTWPPNSVPSLSNSRKSSLGIRRTLAIFSGRGRVAAESPLEGCFGARRGTFFSVRSSPRHRSPLSFYNRWLIIKSQNFNHVRKRAKLVMIHKKRALYNYLLKKTSVCSISKNLVQ
jgi:hypothetical protein